MDDSNLIIVQIGSHSLQYFPNRFHISLSRPPSEDLQQKMSHLHWWTKLRGAKPWVQPACRKRRMVVRLRGFPRRLVPPVLIRLSWLRLVDFRACQLGGKTNIFPCDDSFLLENVYRAKFSLLLPCFLPRSTRGDKCIYLQMYKFPFVKSGERYDRGGWVFFFNLYRAALLAKCSWMQTS